MNKTEEDLSGVKNLDEFKEIAIEKLEYIGKKQDQMEKLLVWAKRSEQDSVCKTMLGQINQEIEKVGKITSNGFTQIQKSAEKIEKAFETLSSKIANQIDI